MNDEAEDAQDAPVAEEPTETQQYLEAMQDIVGRPAPAEEPVAEEQDPAEDTEELEFDGHKLQLRREDVRRLAQIGATAAKRDRELRERAKKLDEIAAALEETDSLAGHVARFVAQDHVGIQSKMITNIASGLPLNHGLEEYDLSEHLGGVRLPKPARRRQEVEEAEADDQDDEEDEDEEFEEAPKRSKRTAKPDPALAKALNSVALTLQSIQKRQDALEAAENARREATENQTREERQKAFRMRVEAAIIKSPAFEDIDRKTAFEMMRAKMASTGATDPEVVAQLWEKQLGKRDKKVVTSALREQKQVVKKHAALPVSGVPPTGRVKLANPPKPKDEAELTAMMLEQLEALGEGR